MEVRLKAPSLVVVARVPEPDAPVVREQLFYDEGAILPDHVANVSLPLSQREPLRPCAWDQGSEDTMIPDIVGAIEPH